MFGHTDRPLKYSGIDSSPILATTCLSNGFTTSKCDAHGLPSGTAYEHFTRIQLVHQQHGTNSNALAPGHSEHTE